MGKSLLNKIKEYRAWSAMKNRCYNPKNKDFHKYGGRGIGVFYEWIDSFAAFRGYIGEAPSTAHSIDRINVNGNYEPGNVRWATNVEQANNRRHQNIVCYKGETKTLAVWCRDLSMSDKYSLIKRRLSLNWSFEEAINTPKYG